MLRRANRGLWVLSRLRAPSRDGTVGHGSSQAWDRGRERTQELKEDALFLGLMQGPACLGLTVVWSETSKEQPCRINSQQILPEIEGRTPKLPKNFPNILCTHVP